MCHARAVVQVGVVVPVGIAMPDNAAAGDLGAVVTSPVVRKFTNQVTAVTDACRGAQGSQ
ncbi:MAG: hypothetical protein MK171_12085 [Pirellulales bacterium]|nr:hypothetical protein [Pirellulales bacterium]